MFGKSTPTTFFAARRKRARILLRRSILDIMIFFCRRQGALFGFALFVGMLTAGLPQAAHAESTDIVPVHGVVLDVQGPKRAEVRLDPVAQTQGSVTREFILSTKHALKSGDHIDALQQGRTLLDVMPSDGYTAGIPDDRTFTTLVAGDRLPEMHVVDQRGRMFELSKAWLGKTVVLSFVFTRCPDAQICPAISGKFAYLQDRLDTARVHFVEVTLDPAHDSPHVLADYAKRFGAVPERWSMLTGEQNQIGLLINRFGLSNLESNPGNFVHDDTLAIVSPDGTIAQLIPTVGWAPDDVIATVLHEQGNESNPLRRFELASIAGVVSLCGGSTTTGQVVLDSSVFVGGVLFFSAVLYQLGRRIWKRD